MNVFNKEFDLNFSKMAPIIVILAASFPIYVSTEKVIYQLQRIQGDWSEARANCINDMAFIDQTFQLDVLKDCLNNTTKTYVGNVKLISAPLKLLGCFPVQNGHEFLMNESDIIEKASVALCYYHCMGTKYLLIQGNRCKCLDFNFKKPDGYGNTSLCVSCADNNEDICGDVCSVALYEGTQLSVTFDHSKQSINNYDHVCFKKDTLYNWKYTSCNRAEGKCGNGRIFYNSSWIDMTMQCAKHNNSYLTDDEAYGNIKNSRRYRIDVPDNFFSPGFLNSITEDFVIPLFGFLSVSTNGLKLKYTPGGRSANYSLCFKKECKASLQYECVKTCIIQRQTASNQRDLNSTELPVEESCIVENVTVGNTDMIIAETSTIPFSKDQGTTMRKAEYPSISLTVPDNFTTTINVNIAKASISVMSITNASANILHTTQSKHRTEQKTKRNLIIVYISVPILVVVAFSVILGVLIRRRISKRKDKGGSYKQDTKQDVKGPTAAGIPEYAVVYKPKKDKRFLVDQPDGIKNKGMNEDKSHDEGHDDGHEENYYVSNDEDYDHIRKRRKINRSNSLENEYNVAGVGTLGNDIYSLAKPIDEDEQTEETYDASLSVHTDLINVTVDDTYDHSSPL